MLSFKVIKTLVLLFEITKILFEVLMKSFKVIKTLVLLFEVIKILFEVLMKLL